MKTLEIIYRTLLVIALIFALIETNYFGWNIFPQSHAEIICDTIACMLYSFSFGIYFSIKVIKSFKH